MNAIKFIRDAFASVIISALFLFLLTPYFPWVSAFNGLLFVVALFFLFGHWRRKLAALALLCIAAMATLLTPFLFTGGPVFIVQCAEASLSCATVTSVAFEERRGVVVPFSDGIRPWLLHLLPSFGREFVYLDPIQVQSEWFVQAPTEAKLLDLANVLPKRGISVSLGPTITETFGITKFDPTDPKNKSADGKPQHFEVAYGVGFITTAFYWSVPANLPHEGMFSVRSANRPEMADYLVAATNDLALRSMLHKETTAANLEARAGRSAPLPIRIAALQVYADQNPGNVRTPGLQLKLAQLCADLETGSVAPSLTIAQANGISELVAFGNTEPPQPLSATTHLTTTAANRCRVIIDDLVRAVSKGNASPSEPIQVELERFAAGISRAMGGVSSEKATDNVADKLQQGFRLLDLVWQSRAQSERVPTWYDRISDAARDLSAGREAMRQALAQAPIRDDQRVYAACRQLSSGGFDNWFKSMISLFSAYRNSQTNPTGSAQKKGGDDKMSVADFVKPFDLQFGPHGTVSAKNDREVEQECQYWLDAYGITDPDFRSVVMPDATERNSALDQSRQGYQRFISYLSTMAVGTHEPTNLEMATSAFDMPLMRDASIAGWKPPQLISIEQARVVLADGANLPWLLGLLTDMWMAEISGPLERAAAIHKSVSVILEASATSAVDLDMAAVLYYQELRDRNLPAPAYSQRFYDAIGGDPLWVCAAVKADGHNELCRLHGPSPGDWYQKPVDAISH